MAHFEESPLHQQRLAYVPPLPPQLKTLQKVKIIEEPHKPRREHALEHSLEQLFPQTFNQPHLVFASDETGTHEVSHPLKVGVVLSGGQAPGGHNVISGIYDAVKQLNPKSELIGFRGGPSGIVKNSYIQLTGELIDAYRNQGGFDIIGSGRTKIESLSQFQATQHTVESLDLDGLVVVGGDDSNTNAALIAEYFKQKNCKTKCIGVPKTIDGDLANDDIEISFGFDTCAKVYSDEIGNIARDARSAGKYWFFIKMMGRSASHVTLECAMQTRPNMALISEEVEAKGQSMKELTDRICDMIIKRANLKKDYGVILFPEGLVEFIPEFKVLILDLNRLLAQKLTQLVLQALKKPEQKAEFIESSLKGNSKEVYSRMPIEIQIQLILDRDSHGNVNVSQIETEKLFGEMVQAELAKRKSEGTYKGVFDVRYHFCGYQGRAALPSNFDSKYCYALGHVAVMLIARGKTGYMSCVKNLKDEHSKWLPCGVPITTMMNIEERHGKPKPVIKKYLVDLNSPKFQSFAAARDAWMIQDAYRYPGPIQYQGDPKITEASNFHLSFLKSKL